MSNDFFTASGQPATGAFAASAPMRTEFSAIEDGFDLMPLLTASTAVVVNSAGTALANTVGTLALAGNFATTGAFSTTLIAGASISITLPVVAGTLATLAGTETFSNKTFGSNVALGTPVSGVATNLTGTAAGLTAGNVTTNANLTGPITSSGNATAVAAQTGTGSTFVMQASPTLVTPVLGVATATSINGLTITTGTGTLTIGNGGSVVLGASASLVVAASKTATISNTLTLAGTDGKTLTVSNSITLAGTDATVMTFPSGSTTVAGLGTIQTFSAANTFSSTVNVVGAATLGTQQTTRGTLVLANTAAGAFATTLQSSNSASAAWTMTLPTTAGTANYLLATDGSGATSWVVSSASFVVGTPVVISAPAAAIEWTGITADEFRIAINAVQHDTGADNIGISYSTGGGYTSMGLIEVAGIASATNEYGMILLSGLKAGNVIGSAFGGLTAVSAFSATNNKLMTAIAGAQITGLKLTFNSGANFTSGTVTPSTRG